MRKSLIAAVAASAALAAMAATVLPADASGGTHGKKGILPQTTYKVVASGLNNPRQLNFGSNGKLYVAEAGAGGANDCTIGGEGSTVCWGATGSVTVIANGHQRQVITGLPSYGDQGTGGSALGPADVVPYGKGKLAISIGYGLDPSMRDSFSPPGKRFGKVLRLNVGSGHVSSIADLAGFEGAKNPIHDHNSDPTGLAKWGSTFYAADSGGNDVLSVHHGKTKLQAVFHDVTTDSGKVQAVPTDVVVGPDHALYISELTGFPFVKGAASIYRMVPGHKPKLYATGLTNVTSMAFAKDGTLYAVQISNGGLATTGPNGALWKIHSKASGKASKRVSKVQFAPYGVAIKGKTAYVSINAVIAGAGQVVKIPLG